MANTQGLVSSFLEEKYIQFQAVLLGLQTLT